MYGPYFEELTRIRQDRRAGKGQVIALAAKPKRGHSACCYGLAYTHYRAVSLVTVNNRCILQKGHIRQANPVFERKKVHGI